MVTKIALAKIRKFGLNQRAPKLPTFKPKTTPLSEATDDELERIKELRRKIDK